MKTFGVFAAFFLVLNLNSLSQAQPEWRELENAPRASRHNDVYFLTSDLGWICNGAGEIYRTKDGGNSWDLQFDKPDAHFRSIGFLNDLDGWAGNVGFGEFGATDRAILYQTNDGGESWAPYDTFLGPKPAGVCGMQVVNDSTICAVGRVRGPAFFMRTTNRGKTWKTYNLGALAAGLIDVWFTHPDTGLAVGLTNEVHEQSSGIILYTDDGGETWERRFISSRTAEWCWKISFPTRNAGYVSLQRNRETPIFFLKTTDGGATWEEKIFSGSFYFVQGIGFSTPMNGWIGGNSSFPTFFTADGGESWRSAGFGSRMNRVRFLNDSLGYAVGRSVYKFSTETAVSVTDEDAVEIPRQFALHQNYPNPFNPATTISYDLRETSKVRLTITDIRGRLRTVLVNKTQRAGTHTIRWFAEDDEGFQVASGVYFYTLRTPKFTQSRKMLLLK